MSTHEEHIELFDRYLKGQLAGPEKESFELRLAGDQAFADSFRVHKILALGIRDHGRQELKAYLKEHGKKPDVVGFNPRMRRLSLAMAASVILLIGVFVAVNYYVTSPKTADLAIQKEKRSPVEQVPEIRQDTTANTKFLESDQSGLDKFEEKNQEQSYAMAEEPALPPPAAENEERFKNMDVSAAPSYHYSPPQANGASSIDFNDVVVTTEKKLRDTLMTAELLFDEVALGKYQKYESKAADVQVASVEKASKKAKQYKSPSESIPSNRVNANNNVTQTDQINALDTVKLTDTNTDDKKNADKEILPLYNNKQSKRSLNVEFWQSPLNFKGYKYIGNTLYLYGTDQSDIKLYIYKDKTYMRNNGQVYLLEPCENGCPFKAAEDKTITEFILKQP